MNGWSEMMMAVAFFPKTKEKILLLEQKQIIRGQYLHILKKKKK